MTFVKRICLATVALLACLSSVVAQDVLEKSPFERTENDKILLNDVEEGRGRAVRVSDKWIGVLCRPVDDVLRSHLDLDEGVGLVIERVVPDSPADRAGLQPHDILVRVDGSDLTSIQVLVDATSEAGDASMELSRMRRGREEPVTITPEPRPNDVTPLERRAPVAENMPEFGRLREWVERLERGMDEDGNQPFRMRFFGPGVPVQGEGFPTGMSINIQREGDQPAKITVQKDNKKWEVTEETLNELPDDIRPQVEGMLHGGGRFELRGLDVPWPQLDRRFDTMDDQLREMMEELRKLREEQEQQDDSIDA